MSELKLQSTIIVKFSLGKREFVPAGIPEKNARTRNTKNTERIGQMLEMGTPELAERGRVREDVVDTGKQVLVQGQVAVAELEKSLAAAGYVLSDLHWFEKKPSSLSTHGKTQGLKPRFGKSKFVVVATFARTVSTLGTLALPPMLAASTWQLYLWKNPNGTNTVNLTARAEGQAPRYSLEVEDGSWVVRAL